MSVLRTTANTERGSQYYVNTMTVVSASGNTSDFYNEAGTGITIGDGDGLTVGLVLLRDMGKTVVSSLRTFRRVQLVIAGSNSTLSTFGVRGQSGTNPSEDYFTGYIELGFEGNGVPAPVAHFGR